MDPTHSHAFFLLDALIAEREQVKRRNKQLDDHNLELIKLLNALDPGRHMNAPLE